MNIKIFFIKYSAILYISIYTLYTTLDSRALLSSQKGPLYGASFGIATLKDPVTQNLRERGTERNLLLSAIVIFLTKREKSPGVLEPRLS